MKQFFAAVKKSRHATRDHLLFLMMYRHGLRVSEALDLELADLNLREARIWVERFKGGHSMQHPIAGDELRAIKYYLRQRDSDQQWLFVSERDGPLTRQQVHNLVKAAAERMPPQFHWVHPHTMRHESPRNL